MAVAASTPSFPAQYASVILKSVLKKNPIPAGSPIFQSKEEILSERRLGWDICVNINLQAV